MLPLTTIHTLTYKHRASNQNENKRKKNHIYYTCINIVSFFILNWTSITNKKKFFFGSFNNNKKIDDTKIHVVSFVQTHLKWVIKKYYIYIKNDWEEKKKKQRTWKKCFFFWCFGIFIVTGDDPSQLNFTGNSVYFVAHWIMGYYTSRVLNVKININTCVWPTTCVSVCV